MSTYREDVPSAFSGVVVVTGSTGRIGRHIVEQLVCMGYRVRVLQRKLSVVSSDKVEVVHGDLASDEVLCQLLKGASVVFHCAAELHDSSKMQKVNVIGTERLSKLSSEAGILAFCHMSSAGVVGPSRLRWIDESSPCAPENTYEKTKWRAEYGLHDSSISEKMRIYILRPTNVVDEENLGILSQIRDFDLRDRLRFILKGGECAHLIHAADVASAAVYLTLSDSDLSGTYFVGCDEDERNTFSDVLITCRQKLSKTSWLDNLYLPAGLIYWLRRLIKGRSLHGKCRFSSVKLLNTGFSYPIGFAGIFERICKGKRNRL